MRRDRKAVAGRARPGGLGSAKALEPLRRSNPPLLEWLQSPIEYRKRSTLVSRLRAFLPQYYSPVPCPHHYLHMAQGNLRDYLTGREVWTKKYFYVLRPVLACLWIERGLGVVPTEFGKLVEAVVAEVELKDEIARLLAAKKAGGELRKGPRNEVISSFVERQILRLGADAVAQSPSETRDPEMLNRLFVEILIEVNGNSLDGGLGHGPVEL